METEDNFIEKFGDLNDLPRMFESSSRFGVYNDRTLGFLLVNTLTLSPLNTLSSVKILVCFKYQSATILLSKLEKT